MNLKKDPLMSAISEELWLPSIEKEIDRYTKKLVSRMPRYGFTETYNEIFQDLNTPGFEHETVFERTYSQLYSTSFDDGFT